MASDDKKLNHTQNNCVGILIQLLLDIDTTITSITWSATWVRLWPSKEISVACWTYIPLNILPDCGDNLVTTSCLCHANLVLLEVNHKWYDKWIMRERHIRSGFRELQVYGIRDYKVEYFPRPSLQMHVTYKHLNLWNSIMCDMFVVEIRSLPGLVPVWGDVYTYILSHSSLYL